MAETSSTTPGGPVADCQHDKEQGVAAVESPAEPGPSNPSARVGLGSSSEEGSPTSPADPPLEPTGPPPEPVTAPKEAEVPKESDDQMEDVVEETVDVGFDAWPLLEKKTDPVSEKDDSDQGGTDVTPVSVKPADQEGEREIEGRTRSKTRSPPPRRLAMIECPHCRKRIRDSEPHALAAHQQNSARCLAARGLQPQFEYCRWCAKPLPFGNRWARQQHELHCQGDRRRERWK